MDRVHRSPPKLYLMYNFVILLLYNSEVHLRQGFGEQCPLLSSEAKRRRATLLTTFGASEGEGGAYRIRTDDPHAASVVL